MEEHITEKTGTIPVVGEKTPNFELPDEQGRIFNLARELEAGPIVLVFYRGDW
ncbi:MAG: peroxiredoxin family protein [Actinomycetota bacterium]|nr:peroxiredoxin family protein [Actinomycetota bacterium]MDP9487047.1 peroxiredoxin family protein [Actinomycetota bacterium]